MARHDERCAVVYHPDLLLYDFGPYHPLRPERITAGLDLLETCGLWNRMRATIVPEPCEAVDLQLVHASEYIRAVDEAGGNGLPSRDYGRFGLSGRDNPPFPDMHYAGSLVAGGTVAAARQVMTGGLDHAFHPAGGLHHALPARASGFCLYNDPAVAAAVLLRDFDARVLYIDLDCHHGDGVQWMFYENPRVFTLSLHESGQFLFPGTGDMREVGEAAGAGCCLNVPFSPFTRDEYWQRALQLVLPEVAKRFQPDILLSNHGCDTHIWDPLTHLSLTTQSFDAQAALIHALAHEYCSGRWIAVGSGGYDWRRVVPRSWAILWSEMTEGALPMRLPGSWTARWLADSDSPVLESFLDGPAATMTQHKEPELDRSNEETIATAAAMARRL